MSLKLYDLALADPDIRPSPYCWIVKFALLHKGLDFETVPVGFADKAAYPDPEYGKVPVLVDNGEMVKDSAVILDYLDRVYPENPLTRSEGEQASSAFLSAWVGANIFPALGGLIMKPLFAAASAADQAYIEKTFRARTGMTVDDYAKAPGATDRMEAALKILAAPLARHDFFGGDAPNRSDYVAFAPFMWARTATRAKLYETPPPVADWIERMLDLFGGYARAAKSAS